MSTTTHLIAFFVGFGAAFALFVWLNWKKPEELDKAEAQVRDIKH